MSATSATTTNSSTPSDRDRISPFATDYGGLILDTRNDGHSAVLLLTTPSGVQGDSVSDDDGAGEDPSPDFFWESAANIHERGWTLEMRVPFTTLRYRNVDPQTWGFENESVKGDVGLDVKWTPDADNALDFTVNPDFSQVEADTAQISANERFALSYPERRPFFLEGVELFSTPLRAVYTRAITSPRGGGRATGKMRGVGYTVLVSDDEGGVSVVIPGPNGSTTAPQAFSSTVLVGRAKRSFGSSVAGLLVDDARLFTARVSRIRGTYTFTARSYLRAIGQYVSTDSDPALYLLPVLPHSGTFLGSLLFAYKLNWQSVLFVGYGDDQEALGGGSPRTVGPAGVRQSLVRVSTLGVSRFHVFPGKNSSPSRVFFPPNGPL
jgi:hypothetical protein